MPTGSIPEPLLYRVVPALGSLRGYDAQSLGRDTLAGLSVAAVAVPQAMAYAMVAGLPPEYGLYTAIVMTAVGAVLDSSKQLINGPTNAISIALLSATAMMETQDQKIQAAVLLALMIGSIQLAITLLRLGDLTRYISHSVIVGFTLGAGTLLPMDQLKNLLGMKSVGDAHDHFLVRFVRTIYEGELHTPTAIVGFGTIAFVVAVRWVKNKVGMKLLPEFLLAVVIAAVLTEHFGLEAQGVKVVGVIPAKLPSFAVPEVPWTLVRELSEGALAIAILGLLEAVSMAKAIAAVTRQKLDINQQCLSEALANISGSLFQCMPGSGSLTRSAINQQAGGRTQWSGVISAMAVAAIVVLFGPYAQHIPKAALAGLLMVTSWKMVDWRSLAYHVRATRFDATIIAVTALSAILISVEFCVLIGIFMSFLLMVPRSAQVLLTEFTLSPEGIIHEREEDEAVCQRILVFGLEGELFFGAAPSLEAHLEAIEARISEQTEFVVLRVKRVRNIDAVCTEVFERFFEAMRHKGVTLLLCGVRVDLHDVLERTRSLDHLTPHQLFPEQRIRQTSTQQAIRYAYNHLKAPCELCPRKEAASHELPVYFGN